MNIQAKIIEIMKLILETENPSILEFDKIECTLIETE